MYMYVHVPCVRSQAGLLSSTDDFVVTMQVTLLLFLTGYAATDTDRTHNLRVSLGVSYSTSVTTETPGVESVINVSLRYGSMNNPHPIQSKVAILPIKTACVFGCSLIPEK